jgi:hypothetical protein
VEWEDRGLERQPQEDEPEDQHLPVGRNRGRQQLQEVEGIGRLHAVGDRPVMVVQVQQHDADQHEHAAQQGVQHVFERGVLPIHAAAPQLDEEVAGDQHQLPEDEKEDQVERHEDADEGRLERQQRDEVLLDLIADRVPGVEDDQKRQKGGQAHKEHADPVHRQVVADSERRDPLQFLGELHRGGVRHKAEQHDHGQEEFQGRHGQRRAPDLVLLLQQPQHQRSGEREKQQLRQNGEPEAQFL